MKTKHILLYITAFIFSGQLFAQTPDDVLNLLIQRGVVTQQEADSIRADNAIKTQNAKFKPVGKLWGQVFSDVIYKDHADSAGRGAGLNLQYANTAQGASAFDLRRVYLGYDFNISEKFAVELLLAHESAASDFTGNGNFLTNGNRSVYLRLANLRWKNIYQNADLVIGQVNTPTWGLVTDKVWGYRSVERSITDMRKVGSSNDAGILLQGTFTDDANYGYNLMVGNGTAAKVENDKFKKMYGEVYGNFWKKRIFVDLYADYERTGLKPFLHQSKTTFKVSIAYQAPLFTIGADIVEQINQNARDFTYAYADGTKGSQTVNGDAVAFGYSIFARGTIIKNKLAAFARYDSFNPDRFFSEKNFYSTFPGSPNALHDGKNNASILQTFIVAGLDYSPDKAVHIIPNVWYNQYNGRNDGYKKIKENSKLKSDYDLVYRITITYTFNK